MCGALVVCDCKSYVASSCSTLICMLLCILVVLVISAIYWSHSVTLTRVVCGFPRDAASLCVCVLTHHLLLHSAGEIHLVVIVRETLRLCVCVHIFVRRFVRLCYSTEWLFMQFDDTLYSCWFWRLPTSLGNV